MAKKKKSNQPQNSYGSQPDTRPSRMYPSLHGDVQRAVSDHVPSAWFQKKNSDRDSERDYNTHIMGHISCSNNECSTDGWGSKKIAIKIREYRNHGYNAVVYNQRCKACKQLGVLRIDNAAYVERVAYRIKKWAGVRMEPPPHSERKGLPHKSELCEGCKRGVCRETNDWDGDGWY